MAGTNSAADNMRTNAMRIKRESGGAFDPNDPKYSTGNGGWTSEGWDILTGQSRVKVDPYQANVDPWTSALADLAAEYKAAPSYSALAMRAAGDRAARDATGRAASARGANSALMLREAEAGNEARNRQLAADSAAAAAQEYAGRYATIGDMLTGAGNLDVTAQGLTQGSLNAMKGLEVQQEMANAQAQADTIGAIATTAGTAVANTDFGGGGDVDATYIPGGGQEHLADVRGKEAIQPLTDGDAAILDELTRAEAAGTIDTRNHGYDGASDPILDLAVEADLGQDDDVARELERQAEADQQARAIGAASARPIAMEPGSGNTWGDAIGALGMVAGAALSDRRTKAKIKPIKYSYSDKLTKEQIELLDMATKPAANRENLGPMNAYKFQYKPEVAREIGEDTRPRVGTMAHEVAHGPAGKNVVVEREVNGEPRKALDVNRALGFSLAGLAGLDKRIRGLEQGNGLGQGEQLDLGFLNPPRAMSTAEREDALAEAERTPTMDLGFDTESRIYRPTGSVKGTKPSAEAEAFFAALDKAPRGQMDTYFDKESGLERPWDEIEPRKRVAGGRR